MFKILKFFFSRLVIVGSMIFLQVFILFSAIFELGNFIYIYPFFLLLSISIVLSLINKDGSPSFKLPWIIIIMIFPIFGGLLYLLFGDNKMRKSLIRVANSLIHKSKDFTKQQEEILLDLKNKDPLLESESNYIYQVCHLPIYQHTQSEFLPIGEKMYHCLLEELKKAQHFIFMEYFIIDEGKMWDSIVQILEDKAKAGLDVRVMFDDIGCIQTLPYQYNKKLEKKGIKCVVFNPFTPVLSIGHNNRDHRKITVIDGIVGFTGGINLADEYINEYEKYGHWKDSAILLKGEAVKNLTLMFLNSWNYYREEDDDYNSFMPTLSQCQNFKNDGYIQPFGDSPMDQENIAETVYMNIINTAVDYVYINTPYLIIDYPLVNALCNAAKRGVDIRIITPHIPDKWLVHVITQSYYPVLIKSGVKIYEYTPGFNHSKTFVSDDKVGVVGTINLDYRSLYHHFECGVWMSYSSSLAKIKEDFVSTLNQCMPITEEFCNNMPFFKRITKEFLKFLAPLM